MARTKKRVYRRKPYSKKNKRRTRRTKKIKLKIKNLGKRRSYKRIQYGCSKKNMKGGGPVFQPLTDIGRNSDAVSKDFYNTFMGNDPTTNEVIVRDPASVDSNYNFSNE